MSNQDDRRPLPLPPRPVRNLPAPEQDYVYSTDYAVQEVSVSLPRPPRPAKTSTLNTQPIILSSPIYEQPRQPEVQLRHPSITVEKLCHTQKRGNSKFTLFIQNLELYPGELTYIGGPSGSGKSTLMKILALSTVVKEGSITILGKNVGTLKGKKLDDLRGEDIVYIPQGHHALTNHSALWNIQDRFYSFYGLTRSKAEQYARSALAAVGLIEERFHQPVLDLSGGERVRVAVAKAYAFGCPICLVDEILAPLDTESRKHIIQLLQGLAKKGVTVAVIAHNPELVPHFHRVIGMEVGKISTDRRQEPVWL